MQNHCFHHFSVSLFAGKCLFSLFFFWPTDIRIVTLPYQLLSSHFPPSNHYDETQVTITGRRSLVVRAAGTRSGGRGFESHIRHDGDFSTIGLNQG